MQFAFAARVLPQGLVEVTKAKSPLTAMLLMFSVAVPLLVRVMFFPALVDPTARLANVSDDGVRVTAGALTAVTVSLIVVVWLSVPDTPVMVMVDDPVVALAVAAKVTVLVEVAGFGLNDAVTPLGRAEVLKVTLPLKPFSGAMVIWLVPLAPCAMLTEVGFALRVKSGAATTLTTSEFDSMPLTTTVRS